ncbi:MAG: hypothetical protein D6693_08095 [Planctomycetota bacterium]|nr:MAG: hypothetical protein D6693_08095 [Planctomycetota bacterium]
MRARGTSGFRRGCATAVALAAVAAAGCRSRPLLFGGSGGHFVGEESLKRIVPGESDREWVLAVFGRPTEREPLAGGAEEIWKYQYEFIAGNGSRAYLLNSRTEKGRNARYLYIQFSGSIVSDWWRD